LTLVLNVGRTLSVLLIIESVVAFAQSGAQTNRRTSPRFERPQNRVMLGASANWLSIIRLAFTSSRTTPKPQVYQKSAEQGNLLAQSNLASIYNEGKGVPQDYAEAAKWYRRTAENDTVEKGPILLKPQAAHSLGMLYEKGLGLPKTTQQRPNGTARRRTWVRLSGVLSLFFVPGRQYNKARLRGRCELAFDSVEPRRQCPAPFH